MRVDILYDEERLEKNGFFARELRAALKSRNADSDILTSPPQRLQGLDGIVMRTVSQEVSDRLEEGGIRLFNPAGVSAAANDKYMTYKKVETLGIKVMPYVLSDLEGLKCINYLGGKVVKSRFGHGGAQVFLVRSLSEALTAFCSIGEKDVIVQDVASDIGRDVRSYYLGGEFIASMLRISAVDFRSNFSLGGSAEPYYPGESLREQSQRIIGSIGGDLVGIDYIFDNGEEVFNEIEDVVGCRMLYAKSGIDIIEKYAEYIVGVLEGKEIEKRAE